MKKFKQYIDTELNPSKNNFYNKSRDDYEETKSIDKILEFLEISKFDYGKYCQFLMNKIFKYTTEDHPTHVL